MPELKERGLTLDTVLPAETRDALRHLELFARKKVEGILHGAHRSRRKGVSTEFDHHKQYMPGDPIKHVDWKASARHERYFVKRYIEDTALNVRLVVDSSASHRQATGGVSAWGQIARIAASLAYLVLRQRDSVGLTLTNAAQCVWTSSSSTQTQLVRVLQALVTAGAKASDALDATLRSLVAREPRRGMVVVLSDLMFDPQETRSAIRALQARGHEVLIFQVRDPNAELFPFNRWMQFDSLEREGVRWRVDTVPLKRYYLEEYRQFMEEWKTWTRKHDVHFVTMRSDEPVETALSKYLALRTGREGKK
ncbi:MAG: DUF58 domain-containing protein [Lentisphaerae bacterium]|nr:DUF58 domain-containing protein [Lentisphaerota bacterium]